MADSDDDFINDASSDDFADHQVTRGRRQSNDDLGDGASGPSGGGARHSRRAARKRKKARDGHAEWEKVKRSWDAVDEGEDGTLRGADGYLEAEKRRRLLRDTTPLQRGIIRHLVLVLDMSQAMAERDYLPTLFRAVLKLAIGFVREYFEQNPISQLGVMGMRDGVAVRISDMSGDPAQHIERLRGLENTEPLGAPSLQNALEMCRGALFHTPSHGTREVLIIYGALFSSDPGDIRDTLTSLIADRIRVSIVGLAAQVAICSELCQRTNGGDDAAYAVALDEPHCRELVLAATTPPVTRDPAATKASLLMMGFPSRVSAPAPAPAPAKTTNGTTAAAAALGVGVCACHGRPLREGGYCCTRCGTRVCRLPCECPACGLVLILSTHLARSYHHLFPLRNWTEVSWAEAWRSRACHACLVAFPERPATAAAASSGSSNSRAKESGGAAAHRGGVSESGRYACEVCGNHFCIDCDVYAHEVVHNCPGCQSDTRGAAAARRAETNGAMAIDS